MCSNMNKHHSVSSHLRSCVEAGWRVCLLTGDEGDRNPSAVQVFVSTLKLWLPWQQQEGGWAWTCVAYECHNACWGAISLSLPPVKRVWERLAPSSITREHSTQIWNYKTETESGDSHVCLMSGEARKLKSGVSHTITLNSYTQLELLDVEQYKCSLLNNLLSAIES